MHVRSSTLMRLLKVLPAVGLIGLPGCLGITTMQMHDMVLSTIIQGAVSVVIESLRAAAVGG